jgi:hypothetical protein
MSHENVEIVFDAGRREVNPRTYAGMEGMRFMRADRDDVWNVFRTDLRSSSMLGIASW